MQGLSEARIRGRGLLISVKDAGIGTMVLIRCRDCNRDTNGEERAYCADCAEKNGHCTWCGDERG
ncbi:MAG: hypothetical protein U9Q03_01640 [Patescibacteria group bacterium]|nr:hypothetical protein [Patescibacteria group bacterium]